MDNTETAQSVFVARQPIFDRSLNTHSYELLFRTGLENCCPAGPGNSATQSVISNSFLEIGLDELTNGKRCFVNFTRDLLVTRAAMLLPPDLVTVEILEDVEPDAEVLRACRELKDAGYTLALDDYVLADRTSPFLELADIAKVDFLGTSPAQRELLAKELIARGIEPLAEKVETQEVLTQAKDCGYSYFQGYFFGKPGVRKGRALVGNSLAYLRLLEEVHRPELSYEAQTEGFFHKLSHGRILPT